MKYEEALKQAQKCARGHNKDIFILHDGVKFTLVHKNGAIEKYRTSTWIQASDDKWSVDQ